MENPGSMRISQGVHMENITNGWFLPSIKTRVDQGGRLACVYTDIHIYIYICMYVCMYVCM